MEKRLHTCMLCEAVCGVSVTLDGGRVVRVEGDRDDPFSRGHVCPKAAALPDIADDPDRIREPMRRVGDRWEAVSWESALDEAGERLAAVQKAHGRSAVATYVGNPTVHSFSAVIAITLLGRALGTRSRFSATSVDQLPHMLAALEMFGHQLLMPVPDVDRTQHFLMLGANPLVSNGSIMTAPGIKARLEALRARGGRLVVVDPRRTETAAIADEHVALTPGTDALLLLGMLHVIFAEGLERPGRLAAFTTGLDDVRGIARAYPPERVAKRTGVSKERIEALARSFAAARAAVCDRRVGLCTQEFGGLAAWLVVVLNVVTGNLDRPGGFMFTTPAVDVVGLARRLGQSGHFGVWKSRVRGLPEFGGELPAAVLAEEIDTPGKGQLRALVTVAGNPVLSTPNGARLQRALPGLDFMVSVDLYKNETTRHAHLILPTSFGLERDHYDAALYAFAVRNVARFAPAVVAPPPGVRGDWDVLLELARRVRAKGGGKPSRTSDWTVKAARALGSTRVLDMLLRIGPYGAARGGSLSLAALRASPHGIDLGPLEPRLPSVLGTTDRQLHLAPATIVADLPRLERSLERVDELDGRLMLIGRRSLRSNNSWMHNSHRLVKGREACTLLMHPEDGAARSIANGDCVSVTSVKGRVEAPVELTDEMSRGVVSLPHGWGHGRDGTGMRVAERHAGVSINDVTDEGLVDALSGNASFSGVSVQIEKVQSARAATSTATTAEA